jgi:hypothetical protein
MLNLVLDTSYSYICTLQEVLAYPFSSSVKLGFESTCRLLVTVCV